MLIFKKKEKMKNIVKKYWIAFSLLFGIIISCSDATEIKQKGEGTRSIVYKDIEGLQSGLNGVYLTYNPANANNGTGADFLFNDLFTDNLRAGGSNSGHGSNVYIWNLNTITETPRLIWGNRYAVIRYANEVLEGADEIANQIAPEDMDMFNHIKAQLFVWRAICHYDIFMYFTTDYKNSSALSAIIMDHVPELFEKPSRSTVADVVDFIINDLDVATTLIDDTATNPFYITSDVIKAYKTKLSLATGDYATAGTLAQELLTKYPLAGRTDYIALFDDSAVVPTELIFGLLRVGNNHQVGTNWYANASNISGSPLFEMSRQLYDLYYGGDVRFDEVLLDDTSIPAQNRLLIDKYPGGERPLLNHLKIIRSSEMAFIVAETQARAGDLVGAANTLKALIDIRYAPNTVPPEENVFFSSINNALNRILLERRKELCFEGHRYIDLKRLGTEINVGISRLVIDASTFLTTNLFLAPTDYRFTLPIPQAEINGNRASIVQNPGY